eukprot:7194517-Prymnesium_polylepis.1
MLQSLISTIHSYTFAIWAAFPPGHAVPAPLGSRGSRPRPAETAPPPVRRRIECRALKMA